MVVQGVAKVVVRLCRRAMPSLLRWCWTSIYSLTGSLHALYISLKRSLFKRGKCVPSAMMSDALLS